MTAPASAQLGGLVRLSPVLGATLLWSLACGNLAGSAPADLPVGGASPEAVEPDDVAEDDEDDEAPARRGRRGRKKTGPPLQTDGPFQNPQDPCAARDTAGMYDVTFEWKGKTTEAVLVLPKGDMMRRDLVVLLHGGGADASRILEQTRFDDAARDEGFALLVPQGAELRDHGRRWNSGKFEGMFDPSEVRDDVAYLDALTIEARKWTCAGRVLAAGFSNGGQMAHRWACQGSQADALLTAAGTLLVPPETCNRPVAVRGYIGTRDKAYEDAPLDGSDQANARESLARWAQINRCSDERPVQQVEEDATCKVWQGCAARTELCEIADYPHGWPQPGARKATRTDATRAGMRWFREHGRK